MDPIQLLTAQPVNYSVDEDHSGEKTKDWAGGPPPPSANSSSPHNPFRNRSVHGRGWGAESSGPRGGLSYNDWCPGL